MQRVELGKMRFFLISEEIPEYLECLCLRDLVPFPSGIFPKHFNNVFREDAIYQKLDELAKHLFGAKGRYCKYREEDGLDAIDCGYGEWVCFIPIDDGGKYRKIPDLTRNVNCDYYGTVRFVVGNADFSKYLWVVGEPLPSSRCVPPKGEIVGRPNLDDL